MRSAIPMAELVLPPSRRKASPPKPWGRLLGDAEGGCALGLAEISEPGERDCVRGGVRVRQTEDEDDGCWLAQPDGVFVTSDSSSEVDAELLLETVSVAEAVVPTSDCIVEAVAVELPVNTLKVGLDNPVCVLE